MNCPHCQHKIIILTAVGLIRCDHCTFLPTLLFKDGEVDRTISYRRYTIDERGLLNYKFVYTIDTQILDIYLLRADFRATKLLSFKLHDPSPQPMEKAILTVLRNPAFA